MVKTTVPSSGNHEFDVRLLSCEEQDMGPWQKYAESRPESGPMHHVGWLTVLRETFNVRPYYLNAVEKDRTVLGIMPLYLSQSPFTGKHLATLQDGILANDARVAQELFSEAVRILEKVKGGYLLLRGGVEISEKPDQTIQVVHTFVDTSQPPDVLLRTINKKTRWSVRQAAKNGYMFREGGESDLRDFYAVYARNVRRLGTPVISLKTMKAIFSNLGPLCKLFMVHEFRVRCWRYALHCQRQRLVQLLCSSGSSRPEQICQLSPLLEGYRMDVRKRLHSIRPGQEHSRQRSSPF